MTPLFALAAAGFKEARRNRVTVIVGAFALVLIALTTVVINTTVFTLDRAVTDFGLGVMSLLSVSLAVFLSVGMLSQEIERRTVFLVVSRPVSRGLFVVGRYLGMAVTLTVMMVAMTAIYLVQLVVFDAPWTNAIGAALLGLWVELLVLSAMGLFFSSFTGNVVAAVSVVGLYFVGHLASDLHRFAETSKSAFVANASAILYRVVPNLERLDYRVEAAWGTVPELGEFTLSLASGLAWAVAFLAGAVIAFSRRDFK